MLAFVSDAILENAHKNRVDGVDAIINLFIIILLDGKQDFLFYWHAKYFFVYVQTL